MLKFLFSNTEPPDVIARRAYTELLEGLRPVCPEAYAAAWQAWKEGRLVGPALADSLRIWTEQVRAERSETLTKLQDRLQTQEKQLAQQEKDIQAAKKAIDDVNKDLAEIQEFCILKQKFIDDQNNLIVKQYEQLARLSGLPKDE